MSIQLVIYGAVLVICGTILQWKNPGDPLASVLILTGLGLTGVGQVKQRSEKKKIEEKVVDLEATQTILREKLFEATGTTLRKPNHDK